MATDTSTPGDTSQLATVLFVDVSGWTDLCARIGDAAAKAIVDSLLGELQGTVVQRGGKVVARIGDELMCLFDASTDAAQAACQMQHAADTRNRSETEKVFLHIGFHSGPVLVANNDVFGDTVNIAARVAAEASRERILATRAAAEQLPEELARLVRPWRSAALKGKEGPVDLVELVWREGEKTVVASKSMVMGALARCLRLNYLEQEFVLKAGGKPIKFGRGAANELVISDPTSYVSNSHGQVEFRGGAIEVVDTSRNGIFIAFENEPAFRVHHRTVLRASGHMTLGLPPHDPRAIRVDFRIE
ncbi:MAG TPA: adenylate/guanylate cyclase domain-containing protein [Candidatus Limnocylindria bacterium]|nr:adenylate/guanylate cyclase domain-containing protein [Candidatus Limnocylindria bacterium]